MNEEDSEVIEEIEESKAFYEVYDGAVYMFQVRAADCPDDCQLQQVQHSLSAFKHAVEPSKCIHCVYGSSLMMYKWE